MYITAITFIIIAWMTGYVMYLTKKYQEKLTCMAAMMIAMTSGMMSSLLIGTVLGTLTQGQLLLPTIISILAGMAIGYYTGIPVSIMAALDGLLAGIMGGMMGAMLGVMVIIQAPTLMILFMNIIFIVVMYLLVKLIHEEVGTPTKKETIIKKTNSDGTIGRKWEIIVAALLILIVLFQISGRGVSDLFQSLASKPVVNASSEEASEATQKDGYQEVNVNVGQYGYDPEVIKVKAGIPVKLNFEKNYKGGCLSVLRIPDFKIQQSLQVGKTIVEITPNKPGQYSFTCGMGMFGGTMIVES